MKLKDFIEFHCACGYGNVESDKGCIWIEMISVYKIYFDMIYCQLSVFLMMLSRFLLEQNIKFYKRHGVVECNCI